MVGKHYKDKAAVVTELQEKLGRASAVVVTEYRGLKAGELVKLRNTLRESQVEFRIVKNSLLRRAAEGTPLAEALGTLEGPTAVAIGYGEPTEAAKVLSKSASTLEPLVLQRGLIDALAVDASQIEAFAKLPGKLELQSMAVGALQGPLANLVFTLQGVLTEFAGTLVSKIEKEEGAAA